MQSRSGPSTQRPRSSRRRQASSPSSPRPGRSRGASSRRARSPSEKASSTSCRKKSRTAGTSRISSGPASARPMPPVASSAKRRGWYQPSVARSRVRAASGETSAPSQEMPERSHLTGVEQQLLGRHQAAGNGSEGPAAVAREDQTLPRPQPALGLGQPLPRGLRPWPRASGFRPRAPTPAPPGAPPRWPPPPGAAPRPANRAAPAGLRARPSCRCPAIPRAAPAEHSRDSIRPSNRSVWGKRCTASDIGYRRSSAISPLLSDLLLWSPRSKGRQRVRRAAALILASSSDSPEANSSRDRAARHRVVTLPMLDSR